MSAREAKLRARAFGMRAEYVALVWLLARGWRAVALDRDAPGDDAPSVAFTPSTMTLSTWYPVSAAKRPCPAVAVTKRSATSPRRSRDTTRVLAMVSPIF